MNHLYKWIYTIVIMVIFVTIIDMLMPNNSMKKFTKLILGLLVMSVIIEPLFSFLKNDYSIYAGSFKYQSIIENNQNYKAAYSDLQIEQINKLYKEKLEKNIKEKLENELKNKTVDIYIDFISDINSKEYGRIINITILIGDDTNVIIDKVTVANKATANKAATNNNKEYESIKNDISKSYNVPLQNIVIKSKI